MPTTTIKGELELDHDRGVIYFHSYVTGQSVLRVCRLPIPIPNPTDENGNNLLDITHMQGVNWIGNRQ